MGISKAIKQQTFKSKHEMLLINLIYTSNWLRDQHKGLLDKYEIKSQHYNILRILKGKHPDPASPGDIKDVMLDKSPDLTRLIDKLISMKLVYRNECKENRRKVDVYISDDGIKLLEEIAVDMESFEKEWKIKLSDDEAEKLSNLLDKLRS